MSSCSPKRGSVSSGKLNRNNPADYFPKVIVAPVSGHGMVEQTGIMIKLATMGYRPEVGLGASGGALSLGLMNLNDWNSEKMMYWLQSVRSFEIFKNNMFGMAAGLFSPYIYDPGYGLEYIFSNIAKTTNHREIEIIITAQNITTGCLEIFSTVSHERSILKRSGPLLLVGTTCDITYLGDIENEEEYNRKVELVFRATSAVPIVFPSINIDGHRYIDGGVGFSSPLNPFMTVRPLRDILYVYPEDIDIPNPCDPTTAIQSAEAYLSQVSRSNYIHDRSSYLQNISCGDINKLKMIIGDSTNFENAIITTWNKNRMVEIFPAINRALPIMSNHSKNDILKRLMEQQENFNYRIFYSD